MLVGVSYLSLYEIFRDFVQLVTITVKSLDIHIDVPMKLTFVNLSDWISLNFAISVGVDNKTIMGVQMALLIVCTIYLIFLYIKQSRNKFRGLEAQAITKFHKYVGRSVILIITTLFAPLVYSSLQVLSQKEDHAEGEAAGMHMMSVLSLILLVIVIPILFYIGIKNTRPQLNTYDKAGESNESREIYFSQLKKHHNPFKELYSNYSHSGAYYKLIVMLFKFVRMCLLVSAPAPYKNIGAFWFTYLADIGLNMGFLGYLMKKQPYHDYRTNRSSNLNCINQLLVIFFNVILLNTDDEKGSNKTAQLVVSIFQLICCLVVFCLYYFKTFFSSNRFITTLYKMLFKEISFTPVKLRQINSSPEVTNRFLNYIYFNPKYYDKEKEITINVWEEFWKKFIKEKNELRSKIRVEELVYAEQGQAPPCLLNFNNTVEERLEENTRILQKIGKKKYEEEIQNNKQKDYINLKEEIFNCVPPIDAYYNHKNLLDKNEDNAFCKVNFFPFPFTCQLVYDKQIIEVQGEEDLKAFLAEMKTEKFNKLRQFRLTLRALDDQDVYHQHSIKVRCTQPETKGMERFKRVNATVNYTKGKFYAKSALTTNAKLSNDEDIDVGKGFICSLVYNEGTITYPDGQTFPYKGRCTLSQRDLQISYSDPQKSIRMNQIINDNQQVWKDKIDKIKKQQSIYSNDKIKDIEKKISCLSYGFNLTVISASYNVFINKNEIEEKINEEKNQIFKSCLLQSPEFRDLYQKLEKLKKEDFNTYLYFVFQDIWTQNQDLPMIKNNEHLLDPNDSNCIINRKEFTISDWKKTFIDKKLRNQFGRGYFGDKLLRNLQKMINTMKDKPDNFIDLSDIDSDNLKSKKVNNLSEIYGDGMNKDLENQGNTNNKNKQIPKIHTFTSNNYDSNDSLKDKGSPQLSTVKGQQVFIQSNFSHMNSSDDTVLTKQSSKELGSDDKSPYATKQQQQMSKFKNAYMEVGLKLNQNESELNDLDEEKS